MQNTRPIAPVKEILLDRFPFQRRSEVPHKTKRSSGGSKRRQWLGFTLNLARILFQRVRVYSGSSIKPKTTRTSAVPSHVNKTCPMDAPTLCENAAMTFGASQHSQGIQS